MDLGLALLVGGIFLLILCSAFFSSSETALMSSSKARLHTLEQEGNKRAKRVNKLLEKPDALLGTILMGNNLVNIGASALATGAFIRLFGESGIAMATAIMTVLVLVFAEVMPKTLANRWAEPYAMRISAIMLFLVRILTPFTWLMNKMNMLVLRLAGVKNAEGGVFHQEDVRGAIGLGLEHGILEEEEHQMLDSILDMSDLTVEDVMIHRSSMETINADMPLHDIVAKLMTTTFSRLPVWKDEPDNIIGILHVKDFLRAYLAHQATDAAAASFNLKSVMREAYFVPENVPIGDQMMEFRNHRRHIAIVVDEYGDIQGLVTLEDLIEEIVGEIEDEHDIVENHYTVEDNGDVVIVGSYPVRDANKEFDWNLPEDDAVSIAGLMIEAAEKIPALGESVLIGPYKFVVIAKKRQALLRVRISKLVNDTEPSEKTDD